jgi:hypothetical protein
VAITVFSNRYRTDKGIGVGSTYQELTNTYRISEHVPGGDAYCDIEEVVIGYIIDMKVPQLNASFSIRGSDLPDGWWRTHIYDPRKRTACGTHYIISQRVNPSIIPRNARIHTVSIGSAHEEMPLIDLRNTTPQRSVAPSQNNNQTGGRHRSVSETTTTPTYTFYISSGRFTSSDGIINTTGYSGRRINDDGYDFRNRPQQTQARNLGAIPTGTYYITGVTNHPRLGPNTIILTQDPVNDMHGRNHFRIHGDNFDNNASQGCIILDAATRQSIVNAFNRRRSNDPILTLYVYE